LKVEVSEIKKEFEDLIARQEKFEKKALNTIKELKIENQRLKSELEARFQQDSKSKLDLVDQL
jgi:hypothetical protein